METLESIIRNKLTPIVNLIALFELGAQENIISLAKECDLIETSQNSIIDIIQLAKAVDKNYPEFDARKSLESIVKIKNPEPWQH